MKTLTLFPLLLAANICMQAQTTCTWTGGGGDGLWGTPTNWSCGHVPLPADNVVINSPNVNLNVNAIMNDLDLNYFGVAIVGSGSLTVNGTLNMQANIANTGGITINGTLNWGFTFQGSGIINCNGPTNIGPVSNAAISGMTIKLNGGGTWVTNSIFMCCQSVLQVPAGATLVNASVAGNSIAAYGDYSIRPTFEVLGTLRKSTASSLNTQNISTINAGTFSMEAGSTFNTVNSGSFTNSGLLKGTGSMSFFSFNQTGSISPGDSPGKLTLSHLPAGTTNTYIELRGTPTPGVDYDQIAVAGAGVLSGTLHISLLDNFSPIIGNQFVIMTCAGGCTGSFSSIVSPGNNPGAWQIDMSTPNQVKLVLAQLLPVELVDFSAKQVEDRVLLLWQTASETNNDGFYIERSTDCRDWQNLGFVEGHGSSAVLHNYSYVDEKPLPGTSYYRLHQVDFDGSADYSKLVSVNFGASESRYDLTVAPNPVQDELAVTIPEGCKAVEVYDLNGQLVLLQEVGRTRSFVLNTSQLQAGIYLVSVKINAGIKSARILKQ